MALTNDIVQAMPVLKDPADSSGVPLTKVQEGDAAASKDGLVALAAKDASDNLSHVRVQDSGAASQTTKILPVLVGQDSSGNAQYINYGAEGAAVPTTNLIAAPIGKDASGNLQYAKVNAQGELVVDTESADVACLTANGNVSGGASEQQVLAITLQNSKEYKDIGWIVSNFRQTEYRIVHVDDVGGTPTETELATILVGPGDYTDSGSIECLSFTSGATGTQELRVMGTNKDVASQLRASLSVLEVQ